MGINLGPVRLVKDINGQPNIVGDGINVAQRVMGFADPGQVLVSRSYYDAVSRLSQEYAGMFHYQGSRTDKHVREHEVYAIGYPGDFTSTQRTASIKQRVENAKGFERVLAMARDYWDRFLHRVSIWERKGLEAYRNATNPQRAAAIGGAVAFLFLVTFGIYKLAHRPAPPQVKPAAPLVAQAPVSVAPAVPAPASAPASTVAEGEKKVQGVKQSARVRTLAETTGGPAVVSLVVAPWGEIYLDGKKQGVSPPLLELQVVAGTHKLEIRNSTFPAFKQEIKAKPGAKITIRHRFK
jgi:hypothetical protein